MYLRSETLRPHYAEYAELTTSRSGADKTMLAREARLKCPAPGAV